jgi:hypothetical protein
MICYFESAPFSFSKDSIFTKKKYDTKNCEKLRRELCNPTKTQIVSFHMSAACQRFVVIKGAAHVFCALRQTTVL